MIALQFKKIVYWPIFHWFLSILAWVAVASCSGTIIHRDLTEDSHFLTRTFTFQSQISKDLGDYADIGDHGFEFSNPILVDSMVVFGNRSDGLTALYQDNQRVAWRRPIKGGVFSEIERRADSTLYFGGGDGNFYSVKGSNGSVLWKYNLKNPIVSKPTLSRGRVLVTTSDDSVYCLDAGTGKLLWVYRRRASIETKILGACAPLVIDQEVVVGFSDGYLVSLSLEEGSLQWQQKLNDSLKFKDINAQAAFDGEVLYQPTFDGALYAIEWKSHQILWKFDLGGSKSVILEDNVLYLASNSGAVFALRKNSGKFLWKFELDAGSPTQVAVTPRYLLFGSSFQYLYLVDKFTGKGVYRFNVGYQNGFYGSPLFDPSTDHLFVLSTGGNLYQFQLTKEPKGSSYQVDSTFF